MKRNRRLTAQITDDFMVATILYRNMAQGETYGELERYPSPDHGTARDEIKRANEDGTFSFTRGGEPDGKIEQVGLLGLFTGCNIDVPWGNFCEAFDRSKLKSSGEYKGKVQVEVQTNKPA